MSAVEIAAGARGVALRGAIYVLAAGLCWSFTGVFLRLAPHFDHWQFLAWRSLGTACAIAIVARVSGHGPLARRLVALGRVGAIVTLAFAVASITFMISMKTTTVANALFLSSCAPLLAAILGYLVLGEKLSLWQTASIALGLTGLLIIVGGGLGAGSLIGNVCAIVTAFGFASASVAMRLGRARDYSPAIFGYGLIACIFSALVCLGEGASLVTPLADVLAALAGGLLPMGLGGGADGAGADRDDIRSRMGLARVRRGAGGADSDRRLGHPRRCGLDGRRQFSRPC
jgi:drug/metabolite transporter, DME family